MNTLTGTEWQLLRPHEYPDALERDVKDAERFAFQSMHVIYDEVTGPIFDAVEDNLRARPDLGVNTVLLPDSFSVFPRETDKTQRDAEVERLQALVRRFQGLGAMALTGGSNSLPELLLTKGLRFMGRDHSRLIVAGDNTYISNVNFYSEGFEDIGYVLKVSGADVADTAFDIVRAKAGGWDQPRDRVVPLDDSHSLMLTAGKPGRSLILRTAEAFARDAERGSTRFSSQLRPGGKLEALLREADPKVIAFNKPENARDTAMHQEQRIAARRGALPNMVTPDRYVNAKLISVVLRKNRGREVLPDYAGPALLIGSDNMHLLASRLACTKECMVLTTDEELITEVNKAVDDDFAQAA